MAVIVMLRRAGEPWLSLRMKVYAVMGFVIFPLQILYVTLLLSDLDAGLADRSAAWRVTKLVHWFCYSAHWPFGCWMLFMPAARFLQALDVGLFQPTRQRFKLMLVRGTASLMVCGVGIGVALFSTSESTQDAMGALVLVAYGGSIAPVVPEGVRTFRLLKQLLTRLDPASSTAKQVLVVCNVITMGLQQVVFLSVACFVAAGVDTVRRYAGVVVEFLVLAQMPLATFVLPYLEYRRVMGARTRVVPALPAKSARPTRFGESRTIADIAGSKTSEIVQSPGTRQRLLGRSDRRASRMSAVVHNGVSLQFLRTLADEFGVDDTVTAATVCAEHVKPTTAKARVSMVTALQGARGAGGALWCGPPTAFISYAWSYSFRLLIDIVERFENEHPPPAGRGAHYYFLDQLSLNQHVFVDENANQHELQQQIQETLTCNMQSASHVLMCLHPWNHPIPLQRTWCLFELFVAVRCGVKLTMCFGCEDADALLEAVTNGHFNVKSAVGEIDAANAGASVPADKKLIMKLIEEQAGLDRFNNEMRDYLLKAFSSTVAEVLAQQHARPSEKRTKKPQRLQAVANPLESDDKKAAATESRRQSQSMAERLANLEQSVYGEVKVVGGGGVLARLKALEEDTYGAAKADGGSQQRIARLEADIL